MESPETVKDLYTRFRPESAVCPCFVRGKERKGLGCRKIDFCYLSGDVMPTCQPLLLTLLSACYSDFCCVVVVERLFYLRLSFAGFELSWYIFIFCTDTKSNQMLCI